MTSDPHSPAAQCCQVGGVFLLHSLPSLRLQAMPREQPGISRVTTQWHASVFSSGNLLFTLGSEVGPGLLYSDFVSAHL